MSHRDRALEVLILALSAFGVLTGLRAARRARGDVRQIRAQRVNGGAIITARYLLQVERIHVLQLILIAAGAIIRLIRPSFHPRVFTLAYLVLGACGHLLGRRARADAEHADAALRLTGRYRFASPPPDDRPP